MKGGGGGDCPEAVLASLSELQAGSDVWGNRNCPLYPPNGTRVRSEPDIQGPSLTAVILLFAFLGFQLKGITIVERRESGIHSTPFSVGYDYPNITAFPNNIITI
jgi:hypothetical protein